ncbi:MAG: acetate--CoA ligase family protein [Dehalococcoidia bacterium]|nr:acetate--CoA ligase family protein [Dehalococcoidia bacterium]
MPPDVDFARIYGPFAETTPPELQALMQGFERPWWIVGGWALDAFTGLERDHEDTDMSIFVDDVPAFRAHLEPRFHLWNNWGGTFRFFDADHPEPIHPLSQIWVREHAGAPWVVDCILTPSVAGKWQSKRDREHIAELDEVTWIDSRGSGTCARRSSCSSRRLANDRRTCWITSARCRCSQTVSAPGWTTPSSAASAGRSSTSNDTTRSPHVQSRYYLRPQSRLHMSFDTVLAQARAEGRTLLNEVEAKLLLKEAGVSVANTTLAKSRDEAQAQAEAAGYPVVLKVVSPDIAHKSDVGGVKLNLRDTAAVGAAFDEILASSKKAVPGANILGVAVQHMAPQGTEVIVGMTTDPQFGPVMMFGLGGIMVEVLKDVSFRLVPLADKDADQMINEIKGRPVLAGVRGQPPSDIAALKQTILKVSEFVEKHPEVRELDLNPVFAYPDGALAVDARIVISES